MTIVHLNVGGRHFVTTESTLTANECFFTSLLSSRWVKDDTGAYFIDRDGDVFAFVLQYLRSGVIPALADRKALMVEADFYCIQSLQEQLREMEASPEKPVLQGIVQTGCYVNEKDTVALSFAPSRRRPNTFLIVDIKYKMEDKKISAYDQLLVMQKALVYPEIWKQDDVLARNYAGFFAKYATRGRYWCDGEIEGQEVHEGKELNMNAYKLRFAEETVAAFAVSGALLVQNSRTNYFERYVWRELL